jgi:condensin complex subunit 1
MRTMMVEETIHPDIIAKLWQAYSAHHAAHRSPREARCLTSARPRSHTGSEKDLPRQQRRGAIIILGMLAVAKRSVVTERLDALLKIGLGPWGKVGLVCDRALR